MMLLIQDNPLLPLNHYTPFNPFKCLCLQTKVHQNFNCTIIITKCDDDALPLSVWVLHHDDVDDLAPLLVEGLEPIIGGPVIQTSDEKLSHLLELPSDALATKETIECKCIIYH